MNTTYMTPFFDARRAAPRKDENAKNFSVFQSLKTWSARYAQRRHLAELDQRLLQDAGLTRTDVEKELAKPFWRS